MGTDNQMMKTAQRTQGTNIKWSWLYWQKQHILTDKTTYFKTSGGEGGDGEMGSGIVKIR